GMQAVRTPLSFHAESLHRIDGGSAAGWYPTCEGGSDDHGGNCARQHPTGNCLNLEELRTYVTHRKDCDGDTEEKAENWLPHCAAHDHGGNGFAFRAQGHADPDLSSPAHNPVRGNAVQSKCRQQQSQSAEEHREPRDHPVLTELLSDLRRECLEPDDA